MKAKPFGAIKPLSSGSRVALVAPSGVLRDLSHLRQAEENARSLGWIPLLGSHADASHAYLAGTDEERLEDLNTALRDDSIDAVWCVRGGYGAMRLLSGIDYDALRKNPRPVIGFSDITALHSAIHRECGIVSFHGPTARGTLSGFSRQSFVAALVEQKDSCGVAANGRVLRSGRARGRLAGGNLSLVTALHGTPYSVDFDGAILVLEDIGEAVYRVDRMLRQLLLSGELQRCVGIVAGDFRPPAGERDEPDEADRTFDEVIAEAADAAEIPCIAGAPFGHIEDQWTIPIGATAELDTSSVSLHVSGL
jgi:muramoyltetrapeptide carboxypeptidase